MFGSPEKGKDVRSSKEICEEIDKELEKLGENAKKREVLDDSYNGTTAEDQDLYDEQLEKLAEQARKIQDELKALIENPTITDQDIKIHTGHPDKNSFKRYIDQLMEGDDAVSSYNP